MPYGKKYSRHMPFGKGSGQCNSTQCNSTEPLPTYTSSYTLCHYACFCFKKMPIRSATDTVYYSLQEEYSCLHSHAGKTSARKAPSAQSFLGGGGAPARQCCYHLCSANAAACNAAAARICRHLLRLIALFAAWALGISSPPNHVSSISTFFW